MKLSLFALITIVVLFPVFAHAQIGTTFWFAVPEVSQTGASNLDRPMYFRMTAFSAAATVTISQPAGGGMPTQVIAIPANSTVSLDVTPWIAVLENSPPNSVLNYGILISSTAPITAYYDVVSGACLCNPEDFVLKGNNALGTDFWIPGQNVLNNDLGYSPSPRNAFDIVATQNGTLVTITPAQDIVGHLAGIPFNISLNAGQTYSATAIGNLGPDHLVGSRVTSNKPIAITEKDDLLDYFSGGTGGADLIGDQIVPVNVLGTEYIPMYGNLSIPMGDQVFITATQNLTTITVNGTYVSTINAGQTYQVSAVVPSCYIQTSFPVYVYQLSGIGSEVGSALLPHIKCTGSPEVSFNQSSTINFKLNLLVRSSGVGNFLVNGAAGVITAAAFTPVTATGSAWYSAQVTMPVASYPIGSVLRVSNTTDLFQLGFLSSGPPNSGASFGYFSNYGGISPNPTGTPSLCVGDTIHLFSDTISNAAYLWTGPGGFTSTLQNPFIPVASVADSGIYSVIVTTPGCIDSDNTLISVYSFPIVNLGPDTMACDGIPITLQAVNAVPGGAAYLWNTAANTPSIVAAISGTYWLKITNNGCAAADSIDINFKPSPSVSIGNDVTFCAGDSAVFFSAQPADYHYLWSTGSNATSIHVFAAGTYWLSVTTDDGCMRSDTVNIFINPVHAGFDAIDDTICAGGTISFADLSTPAGTFSAYSWKFGDGTSDVTIGSPSHAYPAAGEYPVTLTITDTLGCKDSVAKNVYALEVKINSFLDTTLCVSQPFAMTNKVILTPNIAITDSDYSYQWLPANNITATNIKTPYYSGLGLTTYTLVATLKKAPYCFATDTMRIHSVLSVLLANVTADQTIAFGSSIHLNADSEVYYVWKPNDGSLSDPNINNPVAKPDVTTIYTVYGFDGYGCVDSAFVTISIDSGTAECIPSAFSPNRDGLNDIFRPACQKFQRLVDFRIFNRWGRQVFYSANYKNGWDGTLDGEPQDMGVYYYVITVARPGDKGDNVIYKGDVTLIR
jgi:gliding motility-associated-like protein